MNFLKRLWPDVDANRYYQSQFSTKMKEIENGFEQLKTMAKAVNAQAAATTNSLKRNLELYEKRFSAVVDTIDNVIIIKTIDKEWTVINNFACKVFGIDKKECIGKTSAELVAKYPQFKEIVNIMDNAEQNTICDTNPKRIFLDFKSQLTGETVKLELTLRLIKTSDETVKELILIGRNQ